VRPQRPPIPAWFYALVVVRQDDRFVLIEEPWGGSWSLPGGRIEGGEPFQAGAMREVQEEAGIPVELDGIVRVEFHRVERGPRGAGSLLRFVFAAHPGGEAPLKSVPDEHSRQAAWCSIEDARRLRLRTPATLGLLEHVAAGQPLHPLSLLTQRLR
jgi:phosphatase NudJ